MSTSVIPVEPSDVQVAAENTRAAMEKNGTALTLPRTADRVAAIAAMASFATNHGVEDSFVLSLEDFVLIEDELRKAVAR